MTKEKFAIDFLRNADDLYLSDNNKKAFAAVQNILPRELALYHIEEVSFEDKAPRKEALENVLSAMKISGINFIYLILGDERGVHFYYGVAKDLSSHENMELSINDIGKYILEPSIKGNFRGSKTKYVAPELKDRIIDKINNMKYYSVLEGVPGSTKDSEKFQCADRLVDVMLGDNFGFMIIAKPLTGSDINKIEKNLYKLYSQIAPLSKKSQQNGSSIYVKGMEEKYGMNMPADFWRTVADLKMDGQEVKAYIDNFKKHNITDMSDMTNYIKRDLDDGKDRGAISDAMIDSLKELNPDATREELYEKLISLNDE